MPSVELFGYSDSEVDELLPTLREELKDLEFYNEVVYIVFQSRVIDYQGKEQAFLRVYTRNEEKAAVLMKRLQKLADVEYIKSADLAFKQT
jgi:hypothetical protein